MNKPKFLLDCEKAAALIDEEIDLNLTWPVDSRETKAYEDDGCLHVEKRGLHVCIGIGQDRKFRDQNERMLKVLTALDMLKFRPQCLIGEEQVREEEEEDGICPHCHQ